MSKHNGSTYDQNHFRFARTCSGLHVERGHWLDRPAVKVAILVAFAVAASLFLHAVFNGVAA